MKSIHGYSPANKLAATKSKATNGSMMSPHRRLQRVHCSVSVDMLSKQRQLNTRRTGNKTEMQSVHTNTAMRPLAVRPQVEGDDGRQREGFMKRESGGRRCGDSTYRGRCPSTKVAVVWYRLELSHLLKHHTAGRQHRKEKEDVPYFPQVHE